ncbi:hypothetical protein J437_LFUL019607, partial [Ladona fulva]
MKKKDPKVIIFSVDRTITKEEFKDNVWNQNFQEATISKEDFTKGFRYSFMKGKRDSKYSHRVFQVTPEIREHLVAKEKVYSGWESHFIKDFTGITRCYKCQGFGHTAQGCREKEDTCGHCARRGHSIQDCPNRNRREVSANCHRFVKQSDHSTTDINCPAYRCSKDKVYAGWMSHFVKDHLEVTRCYKCQGLGHTAQYCREQKDICGHCAESGHRIEDCPRKNKREVCANCHRFGKEDDHSTTDRDCPAYKYAVEREILRTGCKLEIKFAQLNMRRAQAVTEEVRCLNDSYDVLFLQETYLTLTNAIETKIKNGADDAIPRTRENNKRYNWWNSKLQKLKQQDEIRNAKLDSRKKFIKQESRKGPWSMPYKIAMGKIKSKAVYCSIEEMDEIKELRKLPLYFLENLFPSDNLVSDDEMHRITRDNIRERYENNPIQLNEVEIEEAINSLGKQKAPEVD